MFNGITFKLVRRNERQLDGFTIVFAYDSMVNFYTILASFIELSSGNFEQSFAKRFQLRCFQLLLRENWGNR